MKYVYVILRGDLDHRTNRFHFYDTQVFTSKAKAIASAENSIECNDGRDVEEEDDYVSYIKGKWGKVITYNCLSHADDVDDRQPMRIRLILSKVEIRQFKQVKTKGATLKGSSFFMPKI